MEQPKLNFFGYCRTFEELLETACNELSPADFDNLKKAVKALVDCYD